MLQAPDTDTCINCRWLRAGYPILFLWPTRETASATTTAGKNWETNLGEFSLGKDYRWTDHLGREKKKKKIRERGGNSYGCVEKHYFTPPAREESKGRRGKGWGQKMNMSKKGKQFRRTWAVNHKIKSHIRFEPLYDLNLHQTQKPQLMAWMSTHTDEGSYRRRKRSNVSEYKG